MEPSGNLQPHTKRLLIKQTCYCVLAQSRSKGAAINKKTISLFFFLCFVWPRSLVKSFCIHLLAEKGKKTQKLQILVTKLTVPLTNRNGRTSSFYFLLFLCSCTVRSGQILTYLPSNSAHSSKSECVCVSECMWERYETQWEQLSEYTARAVTWSLLLLLHAHAHAYTHTHTHFPIQVSSSNR